jgi:hypothetical protein
MAPPIRMLLQVILKNCRDRAETEARPFLRICTGVVING